MRRVAVIGSGIAGLAAAWRLAGDAVVTLFEAGKSFGGHARTVDVTIDDVSHPVDTGFLVFNPRTYPTLVALFDTLSVPTAPSEMSFSVQSGALEWSGSDLNGVFAQRRNLLRPRFWQMLSEILRFNRLATAAALGPAPPEETIGRFLDRHRFGDGFREGYLLPMIGSIWSCPIDQMLQFPMVTLLRFCHNHGLLQIAGRPAWYTVAGGARRYVNKMLSAVPDARLNTAVRIVQRVPAGGGYAGVVVGTARGNERFDDVVLACHADQALALLAAPSDEEVAVLGAIRTQPNHAVLHTDCSMLPRIRRAWAAWNYERAAQDGDEHSAVCLHYLINRLQPLPWQQPVIVSLNARRPIDRARVIDSAEFRHPVFDQAAIAAQQRLPAIQGRSHVWFCGAWTGYGFHEDGLRSGFDAADAVKASWAKAPLQAA